MKTLTASRLALLGLLALPAARAAFAGEVTGRITFSGAPPARTQYDRSSAPACPKEAQADDPLQLSKTLGVANAVVSILGAPRGPTGVLGPVTVEQKGCSYVPRVQAALRGQPVQVVNGDSLLHNVHAFSGRQGLFNLAQPPGSKPVERNLQGVDVLRLKCDIHPWMFGWVVFEDSPYFAVTGTDGQFAISGVPAGKYRLAIWHEVLGRKELSVTVGQNPLALDVDLARQ